MRNHWSFSLVKYPARLGWQLLLGLCLLVPGNLMAQNQKGFFKVIPHENESRPEWANLMYAADPNVWEVDAAYRAYFKSHPFAKTIHTQNYKHWRWQVEDLLNGEGFIRIPSLAEQSRETARLKARYAARAADAGRSATEWTSMGPFETYEANSLQTISTHKNIYSMDQSETNPDLMICGTEAGGVFKSQDRGQNWSLISKGEVFAGGHSAVKIHPTDTNSFLVAANRRIYRSTDGGLSWAEERYMNGDGYEFQYHPTQTDTVFCASENGLFRSFDQGNTWSQLLTGQCFDIRFHPASADTVYLLRANNAAKRCEIMRSDDGGQTWILRDNGWYVPSDLSNASIRGGKIAVSAAAPDLVYVALLDEGKANDNGWLGIYRSLDKGATWVNATGQDGAPYGGINGTSQWNVAAYNGGYHQGFYNFDLEVSDVNPAKLWVGTVRLAESADSGHTFISIGAADGQRLDYIHADIQDIDVNGTDVWVASDGGLNYSTDELMSHTTRNKGIQASHFWGFGTGWNEDVFVGGRYHDGTAAWYEGYGPGNVHIVGGVEEPSGYVHPVEARKVYFRTHYASPNTSVRTIPTTLGANMINHPDLPLRPNESYGISRSSGVYFHPRYADHVYMGKDNNIWKSRNGGASFDLLYAFPAGEVLEIAIARHQPAIIYCVFRPSNQACRLFRSTDGGLSWNQTAVPPTNNSRMEITVNPANADEIWVGQPDGSNGQKVFRSTDGGANWQNMTTSVLDGESIRDLLFQGGTSDLVYAATSNSVFYYDGLNNTWVDYGLGLPLIAKSLCLSPFYRDGKLRLASRGRGVWDRALADTTSAPIARPITYSDSVYCNRDTVSFDCYSVLNHSGATWNWSFSPAPVYISSSSARNPQVVFGAAGDYDVTLTVTDRNNLSSTTTVPAMIKVAQKCDPDSIPGNSLLCAAQGDHATISGFDLQGVDTLTISAWVRPRGIQGNYSAIVMNDGDAAGFNFAHGNNTLGYHWPGGSWSWNSGLIVPPYVWSHVAMVATPTGVTLYVNGVAATHNQSLSSVDLNEMRIGSYQGWWGRNFLGEIDEVCLWTRALSTDEIRELRHLTKEDVIAGDPGFLAYYQFNHLTSDRIMDKVGRRHAQLTGTASQIVSTAPVGGGSSFRQTVNAAGSYAFPGTGVEMDFPSTGPFPNGDLWVSRINMLPDSVPLDSAQLDHYWIVNNYGSNTSFSALDALRFQPNGGLPANSVFLDASKVRLHGRTDNGHLDNWTALCRAAGVTQSPDEIAFDNSCTVMDAGQFFITSDSSLLIVANTALAFSAEKMGASAARLLWTLEDETEVARYRVEHSLDGRNFSVIAGEEARGQSGAQTYTAVHANPFPGGNHYRLRVEDRDGGVSYSELRTLVFEAAAGLEPVRIFPNPTSGLLQVDLGNAQAGRLQLFDVRGKLVKDFILNARNSTLSVDDLPAGVVIYALETEKQILHGKLMVE